MSTFSRAYLLSHDDCEAWHEKETGCGIMSWKHTTTWLSCHAWTARERERERKRQLSCLPGLNSAYNTLAPRMKQNRTNRQMCVSYTDRATTQGFVCIHQGGNSRVRSWMIGWIVSVFWHCYLLCTQYFRKRKGKERVMRKGKHTNRRTDFDYIRDSLR